MRIYCYLGGSDRTAVVPFWGTESTDELKRRIGTKFLRDDDGCGTLKLLAPNEEEFEVVDDDVIREHDVVVYYSSSKGNSKSNNESDNRSIVGVARAEKESCDDKDDNKHETNPPADHPTASDDDDEDTQEPVEHTYRIGDKWVLVWNEDENEFYPVPNRTRDMNKVPARQLKQGTKEREELCRRHLEEENKPKAKKNVAKAAPPVSRARKKQKRGCTYSSSKTSSEMLLQNVENDDEANGKTYDFHESMYEQATLLSNHTSDWWKILGRLAGWIKRVRRHHRSGKLTVEKRECLEPIGFFRDSFSTQSVPSDGPLIPGIPERSQHDFKWNQSFKLFQEIGKILGNYGVERMYDWASRKRKKFQKISGRMNETEKADYELCQALGIVADVTRKRRR